MSPGHGSCQWGWQWWHLGTVLCCGSDLWHSWQWCHHRDLAWLCSARVMQYLTVVLQVLGGIDGSCSAARPKATLDKGVTRRRLHWVLRAEQPPFPFPPGSHTHRTGEGWRRRPQHTWPLANQQHLMAAASPGHRGTVGAGARAESCRALIPVCGFIPRERSALQWLGASRTLGFGPTRGTSSGSPHPWQVAAPFPWELPHSSPSASQAAYLHPETPNPLLGSDTIPAALRGGHGAGEGANPPCDLLLEPQTTAVPQRPGAAKGDEVGGECPALQGPAWHRDLPPLQIRPRHSPSLMPTGAFREQPPRSDQISGKLTP